MQRPFQLTLTWHFKAAPICYIFHGNLWKEIFHFATIATRKSMFGDI